MIEPVLGFGIEHRLTVKRQDAAVGRNLFRLHKLHLERGRIEIADPADAGILGAGIHGIGVHRTGIHGSTVPAAAAAAATGTAAATAATVGSGEGPVGRECPAVGGIQNLIIEGPSLVGEEGIRLFKGKGRFLQRHRQQAVRSPADIGEFKQRRIKHQPARSLLSSRLGSTVGESSPGAGKGGRAVFIAFQLIQVLTDAQNRHLGHIIKTVHAVIAVPVGRTELRPVIPVLDQVPVKAAPIIAGPVKGNLGVLKVGRRIRHIAGHVAVLNNVGVNDLIIAEAAVFRNQRIGVIRPANILEADFGSRRSFGRHRGNKSHRSCGVCRGNRRCRRFGSLGSLGEKLDLCQHLRKRRLCGLRLGSSCRLVRIGRHLGLLQQLVLQQPVLQRDFLPRLLRGIDCTKLTRLFGDGGNSPVHLERAQLQRSRTGRRAYACEQGNRQHHGKKQYGRTSDSVFHRSISSCRKTAAAEKRPQYP